jgi:hypothetical protein
MSTPSLLNIPYLYKAGTLYSQIPESGAGDFTVSRTTTVANRSTRINKDGLIELVANNVPRLDYPLGGAVNGCPALLVEPAATNLVLQSQAFDVTWSPLIGGTGVNPAITANSVISPDGTQNAERIVFNRGAGNALIDQSTLQQNITIPTTGAYIFSVYAKASTAGDVGKQVFIRIGGAGALTAITLTANWVRYSRAETSVTSGSQAVQIGNRGTVTADNSVSVDLWGAQAERGAIPTSYIPTTTGSITRSEDQITRPGVSSLIGQTEGTFYFEGEANFAATDLPSLNRSITNSVLLAKNASNQVVAYVYYGGVFLPIFATASAITGPFKAALAYKQGSPAGDTAFFVNGVQAGSTNAANWAFTAGLNDVIIRADSYIAGGKPYRVRGLEVYPNRIPNTAAPGVLSLATLTAL